MRKRNNRTPLELAGLEKERNRKKSDTKHARLCLNYPVLGSLLILVRRLSKNLHENILVRMVLSFFGKNLCKNPRKKLGKMSWKSLGKNLGKNLRKTSWKEC